MEVRTTLLQDDSSTHSHSLQGESDHPEKGRMTEKKLTFLIIKIYLFFHSAVEHALVAILSMSHCPLTYSMSSPNVCLSISVSRGIVSLLSSENKDFVLAPG